MSDETSFALDELLAVLRQGTEDDLTGYQTCQEWRERLEVGEERMRRMIKRGLQSGIVKRARGKRESIDGSVRWVPVYAFDLKSQTE